MLSLDFYKKLNVPCLVVSQEQKILFANLSAIDLFGHISSVKKLQHNFNFDICLLDYTDISDYNPISAALKSDCEFYSFATYQNSKNEFFNFELCSFKQEKNTIFLFKDITYKYRYDKLLADYDKVNSEYLNIQSNHTKFVQMEQNAQNHAVKMSLINKISNQIRNSMDIKKIIDTALKELVLLVGGFKGYYILTKNSDYVVKQVYPSEYKKSINKIVKFDSSVKKIINSKKYNISSCLKEFSNSKTDYKIPINRIIIPIYHGVEFMGLMVILTKQKSGLIAFADIIEAISSQLSVAIVQASLFKELHDKNLALKNALKELKEIQLQLINSEKMASLGHLIAGVAHEINTPLGSINSNNSIIKKLITKFEPQAEKTHNEYLNVIKNINNIDTEAISRITKIVQSLKKFVRLDEAELQETDINNELNLTLDLIQHETKNRIEIIKNYKEIPKIKCYPNMLNQVFMNILVNACQSILNKGTITISTDYKQSNLFVSIKDTGVGMDAKTKKNIFNIGFTTKGVGVGTGIGLAITNKIIEKHKGSIEVKSKLNKGSEFIICIPG